MGIPKAVGVQAVADKLNVAQAVVDAFANRDQERLLTLFMPDAEFGAARHHCRQGRRHLVQRERGRVDWPLESEDREIH